MCWEGPLKPKRVQRGKPRVLSFRTAGLPKRDPRNRITVALSKTVIRFLFGRNARKVMRGFVINKILSFQYRLGRVVGKGKAKSVCIMLEKSFVILFGREVYHDER
jgi:hypothetical protein